MRFGLFQLSVLAGLVMHPVMSEGQVSPRPDEASALAKRVASAKAAGQSAIVTPRYGVTIRTPAGFDEAADNSVITIAIFEDRNVIPEDDGVITYDRFRVLKSFDVHKHTVGEETVYRQPAVRSPYVRPPSSNELIIKYRGGTASVDGISITTPGPSFDFQRANTYVLFLQPPSDVDEFNILFGADSFYHLVNGKLVALNLSPENKLAADIHSQFGDLLDRLESRCAYLVGRQPR